MERAPGGANKRLCPFVLYFKRSNLNERDQRLQIWQSLSGILVALALDVMASSNYLGGGGKNYVMLLCYYVTMLWRAPIIGEGGKN